MNLLALWSLFFSAFVAATLLPAQSELVLAGMLVNGAAPVWLFIGAATFGNVLGSVVNWLLGRLCSHYRGRRWFPVKEAALAKAETWYKRFGRWSLLLSWAPFIGDPLTLAAGVLREPLWSFVLIVGAAKLARYLAVAGAALQWLG